MAEYALTATQSIRVNVDNLTNKLYYSQLYQAWPTVAVGRTVRATYAARF
jgi:outer membrane receptor protein involved in Fe transport